MPRFIYSAGGGSDKTTQGFLDAENEATARAALEEMGMTVNMLKLAETAPDNGSVLTDIIAPQQEPIIDSATHALLQPKAAEPPLQPQETIRASVPDGNNASPALSPPALLQLPNVRDSTGPRAYFPLLDTLYLYAAWLIAICFAVFTLGSYQFLRSLPFEVPLVSGLFQSRSIILFSAGWFLFLMYCEWYRHTGRRWYLGLPMFLLLAVLHYLYALNV